MTARESIRLLVEKCPVNPEPLSTCALSQLRAIKDPTLRALRIDSMTEEQVEALARQHLLCVCAQNGCSI